MQSEARLNIADCLAAQLADAETQWSVGTFGALAEFARDEGEPAQIQPHSAVTSRGGIRLDPLDGSRLFAFETITRDSWSPRVALCLPRERSAMNRRSVLTELGPDHDALRSQDRQGILFDIGIDAWQVDACVRVADPDIVEQLRSQCGRPTFAAGSRCPRGLPLTSGRTRRNHLANSTRIIDDMSGPVTHSAGSVPRRRTD